MNKELIESIYSDSIYKIKDPLKVVIHKPWIELSDEEKTLLAKILSSIKQSLSEITVIHSPVYSTNGLTNSKVILFGAKAIPEINSYTLIHSKGNQLIQADALSELDDTKKKNLWSALKMLSL